MKTTSKQRGRVTGRGFLPGRSGNAGGRPKSATKLIETIQQETRDGKELVEFMLLTFRSGPMRYRIEAAHWLTERGFGKAPQIVEHMGEDGGPVSVKVIRGEGAPDRTRDAAGRDSRGRFRSGVSGNPARRFQPGTSGNPSGKPKNFSIHQLMAEAIDDNTRDEAVRRVQENLKTRRSVLPTLEFAARLNREIGLGSEDRPPGITITFVSNLQPGALKRRHEAERNSGVRRERSRKDGAA